MNSRSFTHNQCLSKGLKIWKRNHAVKYKIHMQLYITFIFLTSTIV